MPGIDVRRDILDVAAARIVVPDHVAVVARAVVSGDGLVLRLAGT